MKYYGKSDIGRSRQKNEDSLSIVINRNHDLLAVVCDGIGGNNAGEIASALAVEVLSAQFEKAPLFFHDYEVDEWLHGALSKANETIFARSALNKKTKGMGTTAVGCVLTGLGTYIFNVGDSRIYAKYGHRLVQMSQDHSYKQDLMDKYGMSEEEAMKDEKHSALTNALGVWRLFRIDVNKIKNSWQKILICSDGLSSYVDFDQIQAVLNTSQNAEEQVDTLIAQANLAGGFDNITVIILDKGDSHD